MRVPHVFAAAALAFGGAAAIASPEPEAPLGDVVATAAEAGNFARLLAAVELAGLKPRLAGEGPWTVLAPTDEAFAALPEGEIERLPAPGNRAELAALVGAHVIPGRVMSGDLAGIDQAAQTLAGVPVRLFGERGAPRVEDAGFLATDIEASNGVIHVVDRDLAPQG